MTRSLADRIVTMIHSLGSRMPSLGRAPVALAQPGLASLNQARRDATRNPSLPAYRQRHRPARPAWPFQAGGTHGPGA